MSTKRPLHDEKQHEIAPLSHHDDLLLYIFSFLDVKSLLHGIECVCKQWRNLLTQSRQADDCVFGTLVCEIACRQIAGRPFRGQIGSMFLKHFRNCLHETSTDPLRTEHDHAPVASNKKLSSFRSILKEFYEFPLWGRRYQSEATQSYFKKGGVIDISTWEPCTLILWTMNFLIDENSLDSHLFFLKILHRFALIGSISEWWVEEEVMSNSVDPTTENLSKPCPMIALALNSNPRVIAATYHYNSQHSDPEPNSIVVRYQHYGHLLLDMLNNFEKWRQQKKNTIESVFDEQPQNTAFYVTLFTPDGMDWIEYDLMKEPSEYSFHDNSTPNIFDMCRDPPYGMRNADQEVTQLRQELFGRGISSNETTSATLPCQTLKWSAYDSIEGKGTWSVYWLSGMEWWGTYCFTTFNPQKNFEIIVTTASATD
ncbi:hypothetical protein C9374_009377 [Naegleria lovaniensis]|uniref:F-box domain-containing protein n=1 Tax=Naegleria lovaniensis TaxID=51637 RepID=A0AA88GJ56_NAELO|nr:uncharacterized protein C9374_009377 [Naegleria lovaniensis]KAG2377466.1 hypothetical protein C9374_009377 [Naegleria lovaniensis]